ncbi:Sugar transport protein [Actinidia chinensis var. chinensis]|uniref:Sugar transport protein n=1 Tax=Actinidia chinensis var. chinensis TaxID=1590841 RepID=A0A2R6RUD7_ACTCC|nr:Sugar transport protein [Actinidia chinensis var. chinensis]
MAGGGILTHGGAGKDYPGNLTRYVLITCIVAAMGGLIFGYDLGISGGVTSMAPFLRKFFPSVYRKEAVDSSTNQYCKFNSQILTLFTSSLYLAALVASFFASMVTQNLGRKISMFLGGLIFLCGALLNALAQNISMLIIGRILLGIGVGFATQSVPLFVSEMAPHKYRGALNVCFQLCITVGILVANLVNYGTNMIKGNWGWRLSLGGAAVPAVLMVLSSLWVSETPNFLIGRGNYSMAKRKLQRIRGVDVDVQAEFDDLVAASDALKQVKHPWSNLKMRKHRPQLVLAILIPFFQQLTGINVVMFYAPELFKTIGFGSNASLVSSAITGGVNVAATFLSIYGTDRWGRKKLFIGGGIVMLVFQSAVAALIGTKFGFSGDATDLGKSYSGVVVSCICLFVAAFACSWGPLGWLVPSEIFPLEIRSAGQSIVVAVNMLSTFVIAQGFLVALCFAKYLLFVAFAVCVLVMTLFVIFFVPETMNIPIEEMSRVWRTHWYWKRYVDEDDNGARISPIEMI